MQKVRCMYIDGACIPKHRINISCHTFSSQLYVSTTCNPYPNPNPNSRYGVHAKGTVRSTPLMVDSLVLHTSLQATSSRDKSSPINPIMMFPTHTVYRHILTTFIAMVCAKGTIHSSHGRLLRVTYIITCYILS